MSVIVEEHGEVTRVTIYEYGAWFLQKNDINEACRHVTCYGPVSYYVYKDKDDFAYSIKPSIEFWVCHETNSSCTRKN